MAAGIEATAGTDPEDNSFMATATRFRFEEREAALRSAAFTNNAQFRRQK
jgi:hypothetical protein